MTLHRPAALPAPCRFAAAALITRAAALAALLVAGTALQAHAAETVKIGFIGTYTGTVANQGQFMERGARLYMKLHEKDLPPGVAVELLVRDDGGANPDRAKQIAQELIVRDRVQFLAGVVFSPNAFAIAPLATEARVPVVIMNAGTSAITERSPYITRFSFTVWQSAYPLGQWAAHRFKSVYTMASDFAAGHDAEDGFIRGMKQAGGTVAGSVRPAVLVTDFSPYMQRVKDAHPDALFVFVPGGKSSTAVLKSFADLGLAKAGIRLIGTGDITTDEELPNMGDAALGTITAFHYAAVADRPANRAFVAAWQQEYGAGELPNFVAVAGWDGMDAIYRAISAQQGRIDPERTMALLKAYRNPDSPRGPIHIDPDTRDIVQNEYLREVRRVDGRVGNYEMETLATDVKDPWKAFGKP
jgi:branched-chain amino acid transport system substrate-binding protein